MRERVAWAWRAPAMLAIAVAGLGSILATSGGTTIGGIAKPPQVLPGYDYSVSALAGNPLSASVSMPNGDTAVISMNLSSGVGGAVTTAVDNNGNITLPKRTIAAGSGMQVDSDAGVPLLGPFSVDVATDLQFAGDDAPTAGEVDVTTGSDVVRATIASAGVDLSLNGGTAVSFAWDDLRHLWYQATAPVWERRASLGVTLLSLVYLRAMDSVEALNEIADNIASNNPVQSDCDAFNQSPPFGVIVQGTSTLTWLGSGSVQQGDDFQWNFVDCWRNDPVASDVLNSGIELRGYTRVVSKNEYTRFGFEPSQTGDGGMIFDRLFIDAVQKNSVGRFVIDPQERLALSGGFAVVFLAQ